MAKFFSLAPSALAYFFFHVLSGGSRAKTWIRESPVSRIFNNTRRDGVRVLLLVGRNAPSAQGMITGRRERLREKLRVLEATYLRAHACSESTH